MRTIFKCCILFCLDNTNNFVEITYNTATTTIVCEFLNQQGRTLSDKSCSIEYVQCRRQFTTPSERQNATNIYVDQPNTVQIKLTFVTSNEEYCYNITASNSTVTVYVEGTFAQGKNLQISNMNHVGIPTNRDVQHECTCCCNCRRCIWWTNHSADHCGWICHPSDYRYISNIVIPSCTYILIPSILNTLLL